MTETERAALEALGYTEEWLHSGLLEHRLLAEQYDRLQAGGTRKTGRYRSQALEVWRAGQGAIPEAQLDAFLEAVRTRATGSEGQRGISGAEAAGALRTALRVIDAMPPLEAFE